MSVHGRTDGNASKTVYPPVSLRSLGGYKNKATEKRLFSHLCKSRYFSCDVSETMQLVSLASTVTTVPCASYVLPTSIVLEREPPALYASVNLSFCKTIAVVCKVLILRQAASTTMRFYDNALLRQCTSATCASEPCGSEAHCPRYENVSNDSVKLFLESLFVPVKWTCDGAPYVDASSGRVMVLHTSTLHVDHEPCRCNRHWLSRFCDNIVPEAHCRRSALS